MTIREFMKGHSGAMIHCCMSGMRVRTLAVIDDTLDMVCPNGDAIGVPLDTLVTYESWFMDRGSLIFDADGQTIKLCTEFDRITFDDLTSETVAWKHGEGVVW